MNTINLQLKRIPSFVGCVMPYRILIDGEEKCKINNGGMVTISIPQQRCTLTVSMVGNALNIHDIRKDVLLFAEEKQVSTITCKITTKLNIIGYLSLGIFQPVTNLNLEIDYIK